MYDAVLGWLGENADIAGGKIIDGLGETVAPDGKTYKQLEIF